MVVITLIVSVVIMLIIPLILLYIYGRFFSSRTFGMWKTVDFLFAIQSLKKHSFKILFDVLLNLFDRSLNNVTFC